MPAPDRVSVVLDDETHQALDLLDELPLARLWVLARSQDQDPLHEQLAAAIEAAGEDPQEILATADRAGPGLARALAQTASACLAGAQALLADAEASAPDRGPLRAEDLAAAVAELATRPERAPALAPAVEITAMSLGLEREGAAWGELLALGERRRAEASPALLRCSEALLDRLQAPANTRALRVLRSAVLTHAGPELRARTLAVDHPEHLALAQRLVAAIHDPSELLTRFDEARAAADATKQPGRDEPLTDGPKRPFTWMHAVLALIVLGLTIWHYWLR